MAPIVNVLVEMAELLRRDGRFEFANQLAALAADSAAADFAERISSLEVWGGAGSVVDVTLSDPAAARRFDELIVDLAEALDRCEIGTPRTRWVAQTIEDWLIANPM